MDIKSLTIFGFIRKHWYIFTILLFVLPQIIGSVSIAIQTQNPAYPFFNLAERLFLADSVIQKDVNLMNTNMTALVGMEKPESGIYKNILYNWKFFWNVIWVMIGNIWLIFFPLLIIYKIMKLKDNSSAMKNILYSILIFMIFMILINSIILLHGVLSGNEFIQIPEGLSKFEEYFYLFKNIIPFHGLGSLIQYLILQISN